MFKRFLIYFALLFALALAAGALLHRQLLSLVIERAACMQGFCDLRIKVKSVDVSSLKLVVDGGYESGLLKGKAVLESLQIEYDLSKLLNPRIIAIRNLGGKLCLELQETEQQQGAGSEFDPAWIFSPHDLIEIELKGLSLSCLEQFEVLPDAVVLDFTLKADTAVLNAATEKGGKIVELLASRNSAAREITAKAELFTSQLKLNLEDLLGKAPRELPGKVSASAVLSFSGGLPVYDLKLQVPPVSAVLLNGARFLNPAIMFKGGNIAATISASNRGAKQVISADVEARNVNAAIDEIVIEDLNTKFGVTEINPLKMRGMSRLTAKRISYGVDLRGIALKYYLTPARLELRELEARLFGGRASIKEMQVPLDGSAWQAQAKLEAIDLERLMEWYPQQHVALSGIVDADLPLRFDEQGFRLEKGRITSRTSGKIKAQQIEAGQPLNETLNLLSNFEYSDLSAGVDYSPKGDLDLRVQIQGKNPAWKQGHPVNLNVNVTENLPALLQSIRLANAKPETLREVVQGDKAR